MPRVRSRLDPARFLHAPCGWIYCSGIALRANRTEVYLPIIVLTADVNEETKLRALHRGATDFLNKPFDHIEVLLRIRNMLETRRIHQLLETRRAALEDAVQRAPQNCMT